MLMRSSVQGFYRFGPSLKAARLFLALALIGAGTIVLSGATLHAAADADEIKRLIERPGDDKAKVRQEASKMLEEIGESALSALRAAAASHPDVDVRLRATVVASAIHKKLYG